MNPIYTTLGQFSATVALVALTPNESGAWADVASHPNSDRIISLTNCGGTDLFVAFYDVSGAAPVAATVTAAFYCILPPNQQKDFIVKAGEALRVVWQVGSGTVVTKIRRTNL